jgi:8-oxo-dGTP pyrophosphatase MutT (NUDIX family)
MSIWGPAWKSYIPQTRRVYGCICISPTKKVLLVKGRRGEKKWSFPKGHRESFDATPLSCALRELKEETGLSLQQSFVTSRRFRAGEYYVFFLPEEYRVSPQDTTEIEEAKWVSVEDLGDLNKNVDVSMFNQHIQPALNEIPREELVVAI